MTDFVPYSKAKLKYNSHSQTWKMPCRHQTMCLSHIYIHQQTKIYHWCACIVFLTVIPGWKEYFEDSNSHKTKIVLCTLHFLVFWSEIWSNTHFLQEYKFLVCWQGVCSAARIHTAPKSCTYVTQTRGCEQKGQHCDSSALIYVNYPTRNHSTAEICWQSLVHR